MRDARIALLARALSTAGTAVTSIAAMLLLHDRGAGEIGVAAFLIALAVPTIATMGIAGRVADTLDSRSILLVTSLVQAAAVAVLAMDHDIVMIFITGVVIALAQAFAQPTWSALVPRIVGEDHIGSAISWQQGLASVASPIGAGLGGVLVAVGEIGWGFAINAATYVLLGIAALLIRTRRHGADVNTTQAPAPVAGMRWSGTLRLIASDRIILPLFTSIILFVILVEGVNPVEVFLVRDVLGATDWQYGLTEFFAGVGGVLGAAVAARVRTDRARARMATIGFGSAAIAMVAVGMVNSYWLYAILVTLMVGAFSTGNATTGALLTSRTPEAQRGRVYAVLGGFARSGSLIALALGGAFNVLMGPQLTFLFAGITGALVMAIAALVIERALRAELALD